jgi:voltage-gated potassium channel
MQLRRLVRRIARIARAHYWFPHVPLSFALAWAGLLLLWISLGHRWYEPFLHLPSRGLQLPPSKMGEALLGIATLVMPVGLLFRSRLVWIISLLLTASMILLVARVPSLSYPVLVYYDGALLVALLLAHGSFDRSSLAAGTLFALTSSLLLLTYATFGSYYLGSQFSPEVTNLVSGAYYAVVTMSTVGYGDIVPISPEAQLFTISVIILGVAVFATSISAIVAPMVSGSISRVMSGKRARMKRTNHFIIVGATALAYNTYAELKRRNQTVTLLLPQPPSEGEFDEADVIVGDANSLEILRKADADQAQAVLAMRADDSENAFIVLAVKELKGTAKTVATINDSKHIQRVKLVQPDMVIAPQVLGGELLAMVLSGEHISGDFLLDQFFRVEPEKA